MAQEVLVSISLILLVASIITILARLVKQPPIVAYLIAGIVVGPLALNLIGPGSSASPLIQIFAHIGVAFLLFIVGLSLDFRVLKEIGGVSSLAGIIEISLTAGLGILIALALGFQNITALYIGAALAFSSTVVIVKILSDKKEIDTLHGRLAIGILIVEDFVAAIALMTVPLLQNLTVLSIISKLSLALVIIAAIFLISALVMNRLLDYLARNQEVLFLFGIAWALIIATLFDTLGFSLEIGALVAGMSLASSKYTLELGGKMKPLRDFFVVLFFVFFGSQLIGEITWEIIRNALLLSSVVIIGKPIIIMSILRMFGYKKRTNFLAGSSLTQISEFSLILTLLGFTLGHITQETMSLIVLVAIITIAISSYHLYYSHSIFNKLSRFLFIFEGKKFRKEKYETKKYDIIIFGYHRIGYKILESLKSTKASFVIIDYNPKVILSLGKQGIDCIYGDASDKDFLAEIEIERAKMIISTLSEEAPNMAIIEHLRAHNSETILLATAANPRDALDLYDKGADYVAIPHHIGGEYVSKMIEKYNQNKKMYEKIGKEHIKELKKGKDKSRYLSK